MCGWERWLDMAFASTTVFGKYWKKNKVVFPVWEKILLGLTTGSAAWMVLVCAVSLTGHGGIGLWRKLALLLALGITAIFL